MSFPRRNAVAIQAFYVRVGRTVRDRRIAEGMPMRKLAELIDVTPRNLQRYEAADVIFPMHVLVAVADALDTSLDELIPVEIEERKTA